MIGNLINPHFIHKKHIKHVKYLYVENVEL